MAKKSDGQEIHRLMKLAQDQGWRVEKQAGGHWGFFPKDKRRKPVFTGGTPSDHRAMKNFRAQLRRAGLVDESPQAKGKAPPAEAVAETPPHETPPLEIEPKDEPGPKVGACEEAVYLTIVVPERQIDALVEYSDLADSDLLALVKGAQAELVRRFEHHAE